MKRTIFFLAVFPLFFALVAMPSVGWTQIDATPGWVRSIPTSGEFIYFRGDGIDANQERAKLKARADAFRKVQMYVSNGVVTDNTIEKLAVTGSTEELSTETNVLLQGGKLPSLEWVDDYSEITLQDGKAAYRAYVLCRHLKEFSALAKVGRGVQARTDAVWHCLLFPGWGQVRTGRTSEGAFFMITTPLAGLFTGLFYVVEKDSLVVAQGRAGGYKKARRKATYVALGLYGMNILDAFLFSNKPHHSERWVISPGRMTVRFH